MDMDNSEVIEGAGWVEVEEGIEGQMIMEKNKIKQNTTQHTKK